MLSGAVARTHIDNSNSGLQPRAVQGMLDFDFICKRNKPSVAGIIYTFGGQFVSKMCVLLPQYLWDM